MKYISVIPKPITIFQSRLFRDQNEHPVRCCVFCSQKINANVQVELASWHMYSKRRSNLVEMDVIKAFSVYPHVARKCCNMAKSTVQKRQHEVITRKYLILSDSRRLFHRRRWHESSVLLLLLQLEKQLANIASSCFCGFICIKRVTLLFVLSGAERFFLFVAQRGAKMKSNSR